MTGKSKIESKIDEALGIAQAIAGDNEAAQPDDYVPMSEVEIEYVEPDVSDDELDPDADLKMAAAYLKSTMKKVTQRWTTL